jgi:hypothetical protein
MLCLALADHDRLVDEIHLSPFQQPEFAVS